MRLMPRTYRANVAWWLAITAVAVSVFWIAEGPVPALTVGGWLALFMAVMHFGRNRSEAITIMTGVGDERVRELSKRALAFAGGVMAVVLPVAWMATVLANDENYLVGLLSAVFATAFIGATIVLERRG